MLAEEAVTTGDGEWYHDTVTFFEIVYLWTDFDNLTHEFVAENISFLYGWNIAVIEVQVRAAYGRQTGFHNTIMRINDGWIWYVFDLHIIDAMPANSFHLSSS